MPRKRPRGKQVRRAIERPGRCLIEYHPDVDGTVCVHWPEPGGGLCHLRMPIARATALAAAVPAFAEASRALVEAGLGDPKRLGDLSPRAVGSLVLASRGMLEKGPSGTSDAEALAVALERIRPVAEQAQAEADEAAAERAAERAADPDYQAMRAKADADFEAFLREKSESDDPGWAAFAKKQLERWLARKEE